MELTAIKVPGKKKRGNTKAAVATTNPLKRPSSGRPLKLLDPSDETQSSASSEPTSKKRKNRSLKSIKSRRKMSDLEKLPTEILEVIFLFCLNINLPNASPVIAGKLSSPIIYNKTLLAAFGPTWASSHGRKSIGLKDRGGDPVLQSAILRCRWATLPVMLNAKDMWIQRFATDKVFKPVWFVADNNPPSDDDDSSAEETDNPTKITAREHLDTDFQDFSDVVLNWEESDGCLLDYCHLGLNFDVADAIEIPSSLLSGPWNEDTLKYLFWLITSGASIDWCHTTSGEVGLEGLKKAITFGDSRAIVILVWVGMKVELNVNLMVYALRNAGGDKFAVITQLWMLNFPSVNNKGARIIEKEIADMMDEAQQEGDNEKYDLAVKISKSETLATILYSSEPNYGVMDFEARK
ncbi:uncharacterized protein LY89DRAFT_635836 [Mollisia scopiformis]|uniref:Uncharacterized protein n=1 Tax=Mollisia scopiformis TaxID=149040 RepID=A0A194XTJ2_MOLSC|nr:uncharacterized protein LY89DRAFT_635836 [Mollisia scopiformis]KUJ23528.1 hypothetical protein LY89DRAFT_635836 [Mollisia scopiformis]